MHLSPLLNREDIIHLTRRFGGAATDAILDPLTSIFSIPEIEGFIGYRKEINCAIVYGDPVCDKKDWKSLVEAFHNFCEYEKLSVIYLIVTEDFKNWAMNNSFEALIEYGKELSINPKNDPRAKSGVNAQLVRRKYRLAEKNGVSIKEYVDKDATIEKQMENLKNEWLATRNGPQIHISHIHLFENTEGKRWFYAIKNDEIIGLVVLNRLASKNGFLLNHLMLSKKASGGVSEMLVLTVLDQLQKEGFEYVSFGNVPAETITEIQGLSTLKRLLAKWLFGLANKLFRLDSKKTFWEKFQPDSQKSYLLFPKAIIGFRELNGLKSALNVDFNL